MVLVLPDPGVMGVLQQSIPRYLGALVVPAWHLLAGLNRLSIIACFVGIWFGKESYLGDQRGWRSVHVFSKTIREILMSGGVVRSIPSRIASFLVIHRIRR
jgi:hypothetical protein